jgi:hypothetical protein
MGYLAPTSYPRHIHVAHSHDPPSSLRFLDGRSKVEFIAGAGEATQAHAFDVGQTANDIGASRRTMDHYALQGSNGRCCHWASASSARRPGGLDRERSEAYIGACWRSMCKINHRICTTGRENLMDDVLSWGIV